MIAQPAAPRAARDALAEDPRVVRTREHVFRIAREVLTELGPGGLTHSEVATRARVSRQTLYRYWPSPDRLVADMIRTTSQQEAAAQGADATTTLRATLRSLADFLLDPGSRAAYAVLVSGAVQDPTTAAVITEIRETRRQQLNAQLAGTELSEAEYSLLLGPIVHVAFFTQQRVSDDLIDAVLADLGARRRRSA